MTAQTEIERLQQAIVSLEAQRGVMGNEVVDLAIAPLREKLASLQAASQGEKRRMVTVLFADLVDHTTMFAQYDPEEVRELLNAYFSAWKVIIAEHNGLVEKFIGDAVMAVFGLRFTHENDAEQAVRAALAMRQRVEELQEELNTHGQRLAMRIGITTGEVVISTLGERLGEEFVAVGETVNMASRLQSVAPTGGILISHSTYRLVRGVFDVQRQEPVQLKGVQELVQTYLVQNAKPRAFRMKTRGVEGVETRMIGREGDLLRLQDIFWEAVENRQRQVLTIVGEAGIGKSRLIYEFDNWLELLPEKIFYFKARSYPGMQNLPYSLVRNLFAFRFQLNDSDTKQVVWEKFARGITTVLGEGENGSRKAYCIGRLLGFQPDASPWVQENEMDPRQFHEMALTYLGEYFRTLAQRNPVTILLEDIHTADDSSLDLINRLEGALSQQPILIVGTARPDLFARRPHWGEGLDFSHRLELSPLSERESRRLVEEILQRVEDLPEGLHELVVERSEGNPFFIEEGIKMLIEEGVIQKAEDRWQVVETQLNTIKIPATLTGLLQARLDTLEYDHRMLLQRAAVIGRVFWDQAVEFLGEQEDRAEEEVPIRDLLSYLREREFVFRRERSNFENTQEYLFKHTLFRDVAYESLLKRQRRMYHARAANWLEWVTGQSQRIDEYAPLIALHYDQAGDPSRASIWYLRAAERAATRYANTEAVHAFSQALERTPEEDIQDRFQILLAREQILDRQGNREQQAADLQALGQMAEQLNQPALLAQITLRRANMAFATSDYQTAMTEAQRAVELAEQAQNSAMKSEGFYLWGRAIDFQSPSPEALEKFTQALALAREAGQRHLEADSLMSMGPHFSDIGEFAEARKYLSLALERYRELGDRFGEGKALGNLGNSYWGQSNHVEAKRYFEAALEVVRETGDRRVEAILVGNMGVIARELLNYSEALHYHQQALTINREIHSKHFECINLGNYAELLLEMGDFAQAQVYYDQALRLAQELGILPMQSAITMGISQMMEYLEDYPAAVTYAKKALALSQEAQSTVYETGCQARLGQAMLMAGQADEARQCFQNALEFQNKFAMENRVLESQAGLARVCMAQGDLAAARAHVEAILPRLNPQNLIGTDEPLHVYLTCCQVLQALHDQRAAGVLNEGYKLLQELSMRIRNETLRRTYLERVPCNREFYDLYRKSAFHPPAQADGFQADLL